MHESVWIIAALFLPLFPLGMLFNAVFQQVRSAWIRVITMLLWPLPGIWILQSVSPELPHWVAYWALFSAVLYGFRAVVVKEVGVWIGFLATSSWSLAWIAVSFGVKPDELILHVFAFSLPLSVMIFLAAELERRYESAYVGVISGLSQVQPRLSGLFVISVLAVIGSPLFPAFFSMLDTVSHAVGAVPAIALGTVTVWLLWSWSGIRLLQELLVGPAPHELHDDISHSITMIYGMSLVLLIIGGVYLSRILL